MAADAIQRLQYLMQRLRDPADGCPWDLQQDFASIAPHTLEECYELIDTIERGDKAHLRDELGDLLFQVIFYCQLAQEQSLFDLEQVVEGLIEKLLRRHPHVFPDGSLSSRASDSQVNTTEVKQRWEAIKQQERDAKAQRSQLDDVPLTLPSLSRAQKLQKRAARVGFDWDAIAGVEAKLAEELAELAHARQAQQPQAIADEMGDVLFTCVNLCRHLQLDAETVLRRASQRFEQRFRRMEAHSSAAGETLEQCSPAQLELLWQQAKQDCDE